MTGTANGGEIRFSGLAVSPGFAHGVLRVLERGEAPVPVHAIGPEQVAHEAQRFERAIERTKAELLRIKDGVARNLGEGDANIFEAHLLLLEDATIVAATLKQLEAKRLNIEAVYSHVIGRYVDVLGALEDPYLRERAADVRDVARRVLQNLAGAEGGLGVSITEPCILVAHDLAPSDTAQLPTDKVLGFVTCIGSMTSHTAIMARALAIPAIVGIEAPLHDLKALEQSVAVLDGYTGQLVINPTEATLAASGAAESRHAHVAQDLVRLRDTRATTTDGRAIVLSANLGRMEDLPDVAECGAEGVGLFRTEFLFADRNDFPSEEEQCQMYCRVADAVKPHHVILRTLDLGGDKLLPGTHVSTETNPFLGMRAIRFCLAHPEILRTQLRAMLRAAAHAGGHVKIMYPMVSRVQEVRQANAILAEERARLEAGGLQIPAIEVGCMIEVPSAALTAETLATEVKFFSIGTNDLIQYTIAIDRGNEELAHLYDPTHPGILRLIEHVINAAHQAGIWVGLCGEMAGEFTIAPLLVGMGIDELSTGPAQVPRIKRAIQCVSHAEMKVIADSLLNLHSGEEIRARLDVLARERVPELFD